MVLKNISLEKKQRIATITLNRPQVLNALNTSMLQELREVTKKLEVDDQTRVLVITGQGEKAFSAGADIKESAKMSAASHSRFEQLAHDLFAALENLGKPVIAAVNGYALGGGCELVLACDLIVASEMAKFGFPEINLGGLPGGGGTQRLPRLVGKNKAKELIFTGKVIDAGKAQEIGLVNIIVAPDLLLEQTEALARQLAEKAPIALKLIKSAINNGTNTNLAVGLEYEARCSTLVFSTQDVKEGQNAFVEKRRAEFQGK